LWFRQCVNKRQLIRELTSGFVLQIEMMSKHVDCSSSYVINENMCFELMMPKLHFTASCLNGSAMIVQLKVFVKSATAEAKHY
jgi:hypothetical protein